MQKQLMEWFSSGGTEFKGLCCINWMGSRFTLSLVAIFEIRSETLSLLSHSINSLKNQSQENSFHNRQFTLKSTIECTLYNII